MDEYNTFSSLKRNGKALSFKLGDSSDSWNDYRCLGASVNRACAKWLEDKTGYKPSFGGGHYSRFGRKKK
jgi:hypothetical protein